MSLTLAVSTSFSFSALLPSPAPSLLTGPFPVIACQINVPLCSRGQKHVYLLFSVSSCLVLSPQPLLSSPSFLSLCFTSLPVLLPSVCLCSLLLSLSLSLLLASHSVVLWPCCLSSSVGPVPSPEMKTRNTLFLLYFRRSISWCEPLSPHSIMPLHKSICLS